MLRVVTRMNIGGPARQVITLSRGLAPQYRTIVVAGRPPIEEGELADDAVPITRAPLVRPISPTADLQALVVLRRLLRESGARILHTHMAKAGTLGRLASIGMRDKVRVVHTFHGHVLQGYFGRRKQRAFLELERRLARLADVLVAVSPEIRDALLDLGVGRTDQFRVIPLGLDLAPFLRTHASTGVLRRDLALPASQRLAGIVGRLVPIKDHETAFQALCLLESLHLAVVGDGELRGPLEDRARELRIADRVHFVGWRHDMADVLGDLDVVMLSSRNEGTPVAVIEALACGRPVVATDVGGVRSVVSHGKTGWLCPPGDPQALASRVAAVLEDPNAEAIAAAGRMEVAARFSAERLVADHRALYEELLRPS